MMDWDGGVKQRAMGSKTCGYVEEAFSVIVIQSSGHHNIIRRTLATKSPPADRRVQSRAPWPGIRDLGKSHIFDIFESLISVWDREAASMAHGHELGGWGGTWVEGGGCRLDS
jgi:hypothetical protein